MLRYLLQSSCQLRKIGRQISVSIVVFSKPSNNTNLGTQTIRRHLLKGQFGNRLNHFCMIFAEIFHKLRHLKTTFEWKQKIPKI
jgi:hypothetical protein